MKRILCYGDSNTFGIAPMPSLIEEGFFDKTVRWPGIMAAELGEEFDVVVEGLPGRTAALDDPIEGDYLNGLKALRATVESHRPIDLMIILLGTNDAKHRYGLNAQDVALSVARLVLEVNRLGRVANTLVICPPAVKERGELDQIFAGAEARMVGLSAHMERFAILNGAAFWDAGTVIETSELDGVHFDAKAHSILGRVVAKQVREVLA